MSALRYSSDLSDLVGGALQVVNMVQLFAHMEEISDKLKYEIARNSMMLLVFMEAQELSGKKQREDFLGRWAKRISDFPTYKSYIDYVKLFEPHREPKTKDVEDLIVRFRRDSEDFPPPSV